MYGVVYLIRLPFKDDPQMQSLELFQTFDEAEERTKEIVNDFIEEYGEDQIEYATPWRERRIKRCRKTMAVRTEFIGE